MAGGEERVGMIWRNGGTSHGNATKHSVVDLGLEPRSLGSVVQEPGRESSKTGDSVLGALRSNPLHVPVRPPRNGS